MTRQTITNINMPLARILKSAEADGTVLEWKGKARFAVIPLNDDFLDFLLERNPRFIAECRQIAAEMKAGKSLPHDEVKKLLGIKTRTHQSKAKIRTARSMKKKS